MLTLKKIIRNTARFGHERFDLAGHQVRTSSFKFGPVKKERLVRALCKTWSEKTEAGWVRSKYATSIDFIDPKSHVRVSCSCPDFCFRFEYALHQQGAANIHFSNGESPGVRNPSLIAGCCKHVIKLADLLVSQGKTDRNFNLL